MSNDKKSIGEQLKKLSSPVMVRPDKARLEWEPREGEEVPAGGWGRWVKKGNGKYAFLPCGGRWRQVTPEFLHELGLEDDTRAMLRTFRKLARAGMIDLIAFTPKITLVEVGSLLNHLSKGALDVDRFETGTSARRAYTYGKAVTESGK